jgi:uncharacterized protein with HEPN domain
MPDDAATVLDIVLACRRLLRFTQGIDAARFRSDEEKRWAAVSQLLLIGEAANRLSGAFRSDHPRIPWPQIAAMRNRLIHEYDKINWRLVWKTATEDVPFLLAELQRLLPKDSSQE